MTLTWQKKHLATCVLIFFQLRPWPAHHLETAELAGHINCSTCPSTLVSLALHPHALASRNWEYKALGQRGNRHLPILGDECWSLGGYTPLKFDSKNPLKNGWLEDDPFRLGFGNLSAAMFNFRWVLLINALVQVIISNCLIVSNTAKVLNLHQTQIATLMLPNDRVI